MVGPPAAERLLAGGKHALLLRACRVACIHARHVQPASTALRRAQHAGSVCVFVLWVGCTCIFSLTCMYICMHLVSAAYTYTYM